MPYQQRNQMERQVDKEAIDRHRRNVLHLLWNFLTRVSLIRLGSQVPTYVCTVHPNE